jgi:enoyl-CoA hydratase
MSTSPVQIQVEPDARVMTVRLVNPPHNFMNRSMVEDLVDLVGELEEDDRIGAVIVTGGIEGKFITHYDVAEIHAGSDGLGQQVGPQVAGMALASTASLDRLPGVGSALRSTPVAGVLELREIHELFLRMNRLDKVFVAAIGGPAMGGGCELALACDLRVMAEDAGPIGLPEVSLGIQPGAGGSQRMARAVGSARALELILEAEGLEAERALEVGLVNRVVPPGELEAAARELAERMARRSPASIAGVKHSIYFGASSPLAAGLAEERRWFLSAASTPQARRGLGLYAEQVEATGVPPWADEELRSSWRAGTVTDLTEKR